MKISSKWHILPIIITLPLLVFSSCGGDSDDNSISKEEELTLYYQNIQNEEYSKLISILPGHWEAYEHYNTYYLKPKGWEPISKIYWDISYTFNSDGTYIIHHGTKGEDLYREEKGTYRLEKNPNYLKVRDRTCRVFLYLRNSNSYEEKYKIWLDEGYLRLDEVFNDNDKIPFPEDSEGEAGIRYKKK